MPSLLRLSQHLRSVVSTLLALGVDAIGFLRLCLRSRTSLVAENLFLRKQLALYREHPIKPKNATNATCITLVWLSHWFDWQQALMVVQPETFSRWRRQGLRLFWRLPSKPGRPAIPPELQALIRRMARDNAMWGQQRIANELRLKLGLRVSPRTIRKYMPTPLDRAPGHRVPTQRWRTFVRNHAWDLIACGMAANLTQGIQALAVWMRGLLQRWRRPTVVSAWRGTPRHDTTCRSQMGTPTSGPAVWSPVIVEAIPVDQRSPPDGVPSCAHDPGFATRATLVDRFDGCPAGAVRCWRNRASPRTRSARLLCKGGSRVAPWRRAA